MFYRQGLRGGEGGKRIQASKPPPSTTAVLPSSDPQPADRAMPSLDTECLTVVVNVLGVQLKCILWGFEGMTCAVAGQLRIWGPVGKDSSPGYSWLNGRQTAGRDED